MSNQSSVQWQAGDTILDLYRVGGILSQDEFGEVYRARHLGWNIDLAIHSPKPTTIAAIGGIETFERNVDAWVRLGVHPHVANAYYLRTIDQQPFVFAEYGSGGTLHQWIQSRRLYEQGAPLRRILDVAIQIAWGLQVVHEQGLLHRNLTPTTVLMTPEGIARVTGVGLTEAPSDWLLRSSPQGESFDPAQTHLTPQADLGGWGMTVLEMFIGKAPEPFGLHPAQVLDRYLESAPPAGIPPMPKPVARLLHRCFQDNSAVRPASLREVADQLREIYQTVTGSPYPRQEASVLQNADLLNKRALALLDLEQIAAALQLWDEALTLQPQHLNSIYNRGIVLWRSGKISDRELLNQLEASRPAPEDLHSKYLLGLVHLERGDYETALRLLEAVQAQNIYAESLPPLLAQLQEKRSKAKQLVPEFSDRVTATQQNLNHQVLSLALSPNGMFAVSGGLDRSIRLWQIPSGRCLSIFREHRGPVTALSLNADGSQLLSGSEDQTIKLWNIASNSHQFTFGEVERERLQDKIRRLFNRSPRNSSSNGHKGSVRAIAFSNDRRSILSGGDDAALKLWELTSGKCLRTLREHRAGVLAVAFDPSGRQAISASQDQTIRVWNLTTGQGLRSLLGHQNLTAVAISPSGRYVLAGDTPIQLWDLSTEQVIRTFHNPGVQAIAFSPDERYMLSGSSDGRLRIWEVELGRCLHTFEPHESGIHTIAVSSDGRYALSSDKASLKLWAVHLNTPADLAPLSLAQIGSSDALLTGDRRYDQEVAQAEAALERGDAPTAAQHLRTARSDYPHGMEAVQAWLKLYPSLPRQALRESWEQTTLEQHTAAVRAVAFHPDGQSILSTSADYPAGGTASHHTLKRWNLETERCQLSFAGPGIAEAIALSPDGTQALTGSDDRTLTLWDLNRGEALRTLSGHQEAVRAVAFHPKGRYAVSGSDDRTLKLWDTSTGRCLRTLTKHTDRVTAVAVSTDGRSLLSGGADHKVVLWDLATGEVLRTLEGHSAIVSSVAVSLDGRMALSGSDDCTIKLWNVATGECVRTLSGHTGAVKSVAFSPDSRFAASGSDDCTLKLWNVATGECVRTLSGHTATVNSIAFSPDSRFVASGSADRTVKLWLLDWELVSRSPADWDEGASPYLDIFLTLHTPPRTPLSDLREPTYDAVTRALTPSGAPAWGEADFSQLIRTLQQVGYGWLRPEGVREQLVSRTQSAALAAAQEALPATGRSVDSTAFATAFATEFATSLGTTSNESETAAKVILAVTEGILQGQEFVFRDRTVCIIGRAKDCHLPLPNDDNHKTVSRYHCLLDINPPSVRIRDLGSLHGTYVNGQIIGRRNPDQSPEEGMQIRSSGYDLHDGDEVKLGKTVFKITLEGINQTAVDQTVFDRTVIGDQTAIPERGTAFNRAMLDFSLNSSSVAALPEIPGYSLLHRLDRPDRSSADGSTGVSTYAAERLQTHESVTLKLFQPEKMVRLSAIDAFLRSVNPLKSLQHPNLLRLQEVGIANDTFFFAFDSFKGESVADRVQQQGKLQVREAVDIARQVLEALTYAHQVEPFPSQFFQPQGMIHGHLTPSNLLLTEDQSIKISDYGIAAAIAQAGLGDFSHANAAAFMPRQQAIDFKAAQPEFDVWAIAACLYYMLTGAFPRDFSGKDPYLVLLQTNPIPIRQREATVPPALAELIDLALIDSPSIHFKNAAAFKKAIASVAI